MNDHSGKKSPFPLLDEEYLVSVSGRYSLEEAPKRPVNTRLLPRKKSFTVPFLIGKDSQQKSHPDDNDLGIHDMGYLGKEGCQCCRQIASDSRLNRAIKTS